MFELVVFILLVILSFGLLIKLMKRYQDNAERLEEDMLEDYDLVSPVLKTIHKELELEEKKDTEA